MTEVAESRARRIRVLPDHLANQIAAGEVVERPASVVKELVENALDAGATRIEVAIRNGGKTEIRVADDGHGMSRDDAMLSLDRHATSKIETPEDLAAVRTLGFRGEALPSIASVSRMSMETASRDGDGTRLLVKGGMLTGVDGCSRRRGTTITVRSLFFNTPARAKFLRSTAAESRAVSEVLTVLALANPTIAFTLESNGRTLLETVADSTLRQRISEIWPNEHGERLIPVASQADRAAISGLIEQPHYATAGGRRSYLFVNGRPFSDRRLVRAVDRGYETTVPHGTRPSHFVFLDIPDGEVDVNVHPSKAEVRFRHQAAVEEAVEEAIRAALGPLESAPSLGSPAPGPGFPLVQRGSPMPGAPGSPDAGAGQGQISMFVSGADAVPVEGSDTGDEPRPREAVMWQVHNTYIFAETREGLIIVDQHSAHERVLYEELMETWDGEEAGTSQRLLFPLTIRLSPEELDLIEQLGSMFSRIGFELEEFGGRSIIVHAVPNPHPHFDAERCLRDMIRELTEGSELVDAARNQHQRMALSFACKGAIKAGQPLSHTEMTELFDRLFATELPFHDIHGRPTVVQLSMNELHNRFRRSG